MDGESSCVGLGNVTDGAGNGVSLTNDGVSLTDVPENRTNEPAQLMLLSDRGRLDWFLGARVVCDFRRLLLVETVGGPKTELERRLREVREVEWWQEAASWTSLRNSRQDVVVGQERECLELAWSPCRVSCRIWGGKIEKWADLR